jgi:hypothetical protein
MRCGKTPSKEAVARVQFVEKHLKKWKNAKS